jgi:chromosome partition protein MukB
MPEAEMEEVRRMLAQLDIRRHRMFLALDALRYVAENLEALSWTDAEEALSSKQELVPSLESQCELADRMQHAATERLDEAEHTADAARRKWRGIDDRRGAITASREQAARELVETGVEDASADALARARGETERLSGLVTDLDRAERELAMAVARLAERLEAREKALADADERLAREEKEWRPAEESWERLRARADSRALLTPAITQRLIEGGSGSVNLNSEARRMATLLEERLSSARGGREILDQVHSRLSDHVQSAGDDYIDAWELVRDWLRRRVPAQIAEVDDPLEGLERLRHHLAALNARLATQETELRGASGDVARGIEVHISSAHRQVRLLNRELTGVHFGTIRGMRIRLSRDDRMEGVLKALRQGDAQEYLFMPTMPVEEALDALFARFGGRGPTVGQKLLDYREYVDIAVEIKRQASADWERVNPSRLSTGEAIGVGTALMMVVLTAWEQAANLFRERRLLGTLRLLFLDEANRLSRDNLEVLFELCTSLELQLLIASPEVPRAPGCTTYRLVRRETADGGEEVVVSGRRAFMQNSRDVGT